MTRALAALPLAAALAALAAAPALAQDGPPPGEGAAAASPRPIELYTQPLPDPGGGLKAVVRLYDPETGGPLRGAEYRLAVIGTGGTAFLSEGPLRAPEGEAAVDTGITEPGRYVVAATAERAAPWPAPPAVAFTVASVGGRAAEDFADPVLLAPDTRPAAPVMRVGTDREHYAPGSRVAISGGVAGAATGAVDLLVVPPSGGPPAQLRAEVNDRGAFDAGLRAGVPPLEGHGPHAVFASHGKSWAAAAFWVTPGAPSPPNFTAVLMPPGAGAPGCEAEGRCSVPEHAAVPAGERVTWTNADSVAHTVTSGWRGSPDGLFGSGEIAPRGVFQATFAEAGDYPYHCAIHPWREGMVTVTGDGPRRPPSASLYLGPSKDVFEAGGPAGAWVRVEAGAGPHEARLRAAGPSGAAVLDRAVETDSLGRASVGFVLPRGAPPGAYALEAEAGAGGRALSASTSFLVAPPYALVEVGSVEWAGPGGRPARGEAGAVLVGLRAHDAREVQGGALVTATLFDSEGAAVAVAHARAALPPGGAEASLPMGVPAHAAPGPGSLRVSVLSGWPSAGGVPYAGGTVTAVEVA